MTEPRQEIEDVGEFYEHEKKLATMCLGAIQRRYAARREPLGMPDVQRRFANETKGVCGENGLLVEVDFEYSEEYDSNQPDKILDSPTVSDDPDDETIYYCPRIRVVGRVNKVKEFDHDRQQHEIRAGVLDGVKGVIDPNSGQLKEDSKKKVIY